MGPEKFSASPSSQDQSFNNETLVFWGEVLKYRNSVACVLKYGVNIRNMLYVFCLGCENFSAPPCACIYTYVCVYYEEVIQGLLSD